MNGASKLSEALNSHPSVLDYIIGLSPHEFERLRNPLMRKVMPQRITLRRIALMVGMPESALVAAINKIAGLPVDMSAESSKNSPLPLSAKMAPEWLTDFPPDQIEWIDVTPLDEVLSDPMPPISIAINTVKPGGVVGIKHKWEPQPFYDIWHARGFEFWSQQISPDLWHIFVYRPDDVDPALH